MGRMRRLHSPTTWVALLAGGAVAGAIALAMGPAHAEAASTTAMLTLTGMTDSNCQVSTGGTTAHVAPGGTVTLKPSLAGASVTIPGLGLLPDTTIPLDSSQVASFVETVVIDGEKNHPKKLTKPSDKIVLNNVKGTHAVEWKATAVSILGGIGTIPLNGDNVNLPAGGELDWSGKIVASKDTNCGIAVSVPTTKIHAGSHTVTVPGANVSVPNPVPSILSKLPKLPSVPGTGNHGGGTNSGGNGSGGGVNYKPPALTVPQQVMPHAVNYGGNGRLAAPAAGGAAPGGRLVAPAPSVTATAAPAPTATPVAKVRADPDTARPDRLGGAQLPALLAIAAVLALAGVTAAYAKLYLLPRAK